MAETIYVPLLDEGTDVWRPVEALRVAEDVYFILGTMPGDEVWAFPPGSKVRCKRRHFNFEVEQLVATSLTS